MLKIMLFHVFGLKCENQMIERFHFINKQVLSVLVNVKIIISNPLVVKML